MSQIVHRANLSYQTFPLFPSKQGRTVVIDNQDVTFYPKPVDQDDFGRRQDYRGFPSLLYCHNALPTDRGLKSISFVSRIGAISGNHYAAAIHEIVPGTFLCFDYTDLRIRMNGANGGLNWSSAVFSGVPNAVVETYTIAKIGADVYMSVFTAAAGNRIYSWSEGTRRFNLTPPSGVVEADIDGITESNGYMILWDDDTITWSSTLDPLDFVPSLITGAGNAKIQEAKGNIVYCFSVTGGFIIVCEENCVAAIYTGNPRYPFTFKEIKGSGGFDVSDLYVTSGTTTFIDYNIIDRAISKGGNVGDSLYFFNTSGIQKFSLTEAKTVLSEITDFIEGDKFETFDEVTKTFVQTVKNRSITGYPTNEKRLTFIANRYLIISYNGSAYTRDAAQISFTDALVFDLALGKWGKIKYTHTAVLEFLFAGLRPKPDKDSAGTATISEIKESPADSIGFLKSSGEVVTIALNTIDGSDTGVAIFGRFQWMRNNFFDLQHVEVDGVRDADTEIFDLPSLDGMNFLTAVEEYQDTQSGTYRKSNFNVSGLNHCIGINGSFDISSLVLTLVPGGRR